MDSTLNYLNTAITLALAIGAIYAFYRGRKVETTRIQAETITALQAQVDAIKEKLESLEKENLRLRQIIETIQAALHKKGIHITVDGGIVTIEETGRVRKTQRRITQTEEK